MTKATIIHIDVSGPTSSGKSAVIASIADLLQRSEYTVAFADRSKRLNPDDTIGLSDFHLRPRLDNTIFSLTETNTPLPKEAK